jgi:hypothetical protein
MKGPFGRLRFDVRRAWECPLCHRRESTGGQVVVLTCRNCKAAAPGQDVWMHLHEESNQSGENPHVSMDQPEPS